MTAAVRARRPSAPSAVELALELAVPAVSLAVVAGFARLFDDGIFFWRLAVPTLAAHALAAVTRRLGLGLAASGLVSAAGLVVVMGLVHYPETLNLGLPTGTTRTALEADLRASWELFDEVGPPAPVLTGYLVVAGTALWLAAFLADWAAFRLRSVVETLLPTGAVFLFCTIYTKEHHREVAAAVYLAAVLLLLLVHRTRRQVEDATWLGSPARGAGTLVRAGALLGAAVVLGVVVAGPSLPGADAEAVVAWRELRDRNDARVTISPLVDIRATLVQQSDVVVFTVEADEPDYWRLTSLDRFNGLVWESSGSFDDADGVLGTSLPDGTTTSPLRQTFRIRALGDFWLPAAFEPAVVIDDGGAAPVYEAASGTLVVGEAVADADGLTYTLESRRPVRDAATVAAAGGLVPAEIADRYLDLPADFDPAVAEVAAQVTAPATTPYGQALLLQNWFRDTFVYDLDVAEGHSIGSIADFLEARRGYCEQFAGAYAAMARSLGLPSRVAVGFTPGEQDGTTFTVRGEHAHAWPEIWISGVGWLRFEPTPGRGAPGDTAYTGVEPAQAAPGEAAGAVTVPTPSTAPSGTAPPASAGDPTGFDLGDVPVAPQTSTPSADDGPSRWPAVLAALAVLAVLWLLGVPLLKRLRRRRARRAARDRRDRIRLAWSELLDDLETSGLGREPAETPLEHAHRVAPMLASGAELRALADLVTVAGFAADQPGEEVEVAVRRAAAAVRDDLRSLQSVPRRVSAALDPRPLLARRVA